MCTHGELIQARKEKINGRNSGLSKSLWTCITSHSHFITNCWIFLCIETMGEEIFIAALGWLRERLNWGGAPMKD